MPDFNCVHGLARQCLICGFYMVDGQRINYGEIEDFGAATESEVKFLKHIQRHSVTAFFHEGKLHIPNDQGRSVPLAIGLQWQVWQLRQIEIDELKEQQNKLMAYVESTCSPDLVSELERIIGH